MNTMMQAEFDGLEMVKVCPGYTDYSEIKVFPEACNFGNNCRFASGTVFEGDCDFGHRCTFGAGCVFHGTVHFGNDCPLDGAILHGNHGFGKNCILTNCEDAAE